MEEAGGGGIERGREGAKVGREQGSKGERETSRKVS